ncbi:MAG: ATP-binding cassette domain-containing protein, partial [Clostridiales bacterium]|nr:ATP-binding cassette domain-containing protein [Clostridiales bacterium]
MRRLEGELSSAPHGSAEQARLIAKYDRARTLFELADGYEYESRIRGVLNGLDIGAGIGDGTPVSILSGGQKTRLALALMLIKPPALLLLDEPTNHLDIRSLEWLEGYLKNYRRAFLVVSHDRYFLDAVTTSTLEIEHRRLAEFGGPYSFYVKKKAENRAAQERLYANQQREIARIEAFIEQQRRWNRERNIIAAESRQKALDRMEKAERPKAAPKKVSIRFNNAISNSNDVMYINGVSKAYGTLRLFEPFSALVRRRDRILILGSNGCGKSTLLRILSGRLEPDGGQLETGGKISVGYYDQEHYDLSDDKAVLDEVYDENARLPLADVRGALAAFLFHGDDVFKKTGSLSGGEKARLALVKLILSRANLLMLDEPTNHLDIGTRETLEDALMNFDGAILSVSHDRYFIRQLATRIFYFEGGRICDFHGGYDAYLAFLAARDDAGGAPGAHGDRNAHGAHGDHGGHGGYGTPRAAAGARVSGAGTGAGADAGIGAGVGRAARPAGASAETGT